MWPPSPASGRGGLSREVEAWRVRVAQRGAPLLRHAHPHADAVTFGRVALVEHRLAHSEAYREAVVRRTAHPVVVQPVDGNGAGLAIARGVGNEREEELRVLERPVRKVRDRCFASESVRRIDMRAGTEEMVVEEAADADGARRRRDFRISVEREPRWLPIRERRLAEQSDLGEV